MTKKFIYLPIEVKVREFWPKLWLTSRLVKKNFVCIIGNKTGVHSAMKVYPPGIYFRKSISNRKVISNHLRELNKRGYISVCQDEEAGIARDELASFYKIRTSDDNIQMISRFYCWGKNDYEYLVKKYPHFKKKLCMTGAPRIDLWRSEFASIVYQKEIQDLTIRFGQYILINSAFGSTSEEEIKKRMEQSLAYGYITKQEYPEVLENRKKRLQSFYFFVDMINEIATKRPNHNFVVRPHPSENINEWKKLLANNDNLFLVREGDVTPWISACKAMIHDGCTTGMQGVVMGKPVIAYKTENSSSLGNNFPNLVSLQVKTIEELSQAFDIIEEREVIDSKAYSKKNELLKARIANIVGPYAADLIAEDLESLDVQTALPPSNSKLYTWKQYLRLRQVLSRLTDFKSNQKSSRVLPLRSSKEKIPGGIQEHEIRSFMKKLEAVDTDVLNIRIKQIVKNAFAISF